MIFFKRRLLLWLVKAYIKRWSKRILLFFVIGLLVFFVLLKLIQIYIPKIPVGEKESIGMVGSYTLNSLPSSIMEEISRGLTSVSPKDGTVKPDLAKLWTIQDNGKKYIFYLKQDVYFSDGDNLTSKTINYSFSDVVTERPDMYTIIFKLKESYSPFLVTVSRPILKRGFIGIGEYKIKDVAFNGDFVEYITLVLLKNQYKVKTYHFYPSQEALKLAFVQGEVSKMVGLTNISYNKSSLEYFNNVNIAKNINYSRLVTLFYNYKDSVVSNEKLRSGLSYAMPDEFRLGKRNLAPISDDSWAYSQSIADRKQDLEHASNLITDSQTASKGAEVTLTFKTLAKYKETAQEIATVWKQVNVNAKIEVVDAIPNTFQIFLGDFRVPKDPDQYSLWHSAQENNITKYEKKRIDKLLEDGRKVTDIEERKKLYADFQKYLMVDPPASFLYFPYEYEVKRK